MQKLLIYWVCGASLLASGCSTVKDIGNAIPNALGRLPLIYHQDVQQGNVISQETVNKLEPGMTKSQVSYLMGTPVLVDVFHQDRWDYVFTMKKGSEEAKREVMSLHFSDDRLARIEGDFRPSPISEESLQAKEDEAVISVPDYTGDRKGIVTRVLESVGVEVQD